MRKLLTFLIALAAIWARDGRDHIAPVAMLGSAGLSP
jgi:hypothetical protein